MVASSDKKFLYWNNSLQMINVNPEILRKITESEEFDQQLKEVSEENPRFREIPKDSQRIALALLMMGELNSIEEMERIYVRRKMPTIQEFLTPEYIGETAYDIYPKWKEDLFEVFEPKSTIRQWAMTGSIGSGKTSIAVIAQLYNTFRINCLRRPQRSMGSDPTKAMNLQLFTVTKGKATSLLYDRVKTFLNQCQHYVYVPGKKDFLDFQDERYEHITPWTEDYDEDGPYVEFPNLVRIRSGSQPRHALGEDVFGGILDEAEFRAGLVAGKVEDTFNLYYEILERIRSRFIGSRFTLMCMLSSIKNARGVMAKHIEEARDRADSKVSQYAIWDTKIPTAFEEDGYFYVLRGTMRHPSKVMSEHDKELIDSGFLDPPASCKFIKVPERFRDDFEGNTERSLMNLAGEVSLGGEVPFDDVDDMVDDSLCPVIEISAPLLAKEPLRSQLPKEYFIKTPQGLRLRRYPDAPRYCHIDLADTGEAGLTVLHKELSIEVNGKAIFVVDFCMRITSPNRVNIDSIRDLMFDFREHYGISFAIVTADQYQSTQMLQKFEAVNFATVKSFRASVDTNRDPYDSLSAAISQDNVKVGRLGILKSQLMSIYFERDKPRSTGRKDVADSLCGAVYNAMKNGLDVPINAYETFNQTEQFVAKLKENMDEISF